MSAAETVRVAGDRIGPASAVVSGEGTFVRGHFVFASISGFERRSAATDSSKQVVEVVSAKAPSVLPLVGSLILAHVNRVSARVANVDMVGVDGKTIPDKFTGIIRQQDVRATEIDKVDMHSSFRPGDLVLAKVMSLGDSRAYYLTTACNELGVVFAKSMAGYAMVPLNWQEMMCPVTKQKEMRKVAKTDAKKSSA